MGVEIRHATPADYPVLEVVRRQAIEASYADVYDRADYATDVATPVQELDSWIESPDHLTLVAESDVTPVAYLAGDLRSGQLLHLYTSPDYARRGYASQLVDAAVTKTEMPNVWAWCPKPALEFFTTIGFARTDRTRVIDGIPHWYVERLTSDR